jgi:hypothetical protein
MTVGMVERKGRRHEREENTHNNNVPHVDPVMFVNPKP